MLHGKEGLLIKDYWIYQKRAVSVPWALYIVKEYDRNRLKMPTLDVTFYSEHIGNATNSKSIVNLKGDSIDYYVNALVTEILEFSDVTNEDLEQLRKSLTDIFIG